MQFVDCRFNSNGRDLAGVVDETPQSHGLRGATAYGSQYGNGFDVETYGSGYQVKDVAFARCEALQNVRAGILFYEIANQQAADFVPSREIRIEDCLIDSGVSSNLFALDFTSTIENKNGPSVLRDIAMKGNTVVGQLGLRCVEDVMISGGSVSTSSSRLGNADNARRIYIAPSVNRGGKVFDEFESSLTYEVL